MTLEIARRRIGGIWRTRAAEENGGSQTLQRTAAIPISALQLATLDTVPVELVAAPGPGFVLVAEALYWFYTAGATQGDGDGTLVVTWDGQDPNSVDLLSCSAALFRADDRFSSGVGAGEARKVLTIAEDKALVLFLSAPVTGGDGSGVLYLDYTIVPTS